MSQNELQRVVAELDELIARDEEQQDYCSETGPNEAMRRVVALIGIRRRLIAAASRIEAAQAVAPGGDAFERAMKASWEMVVAHPTWAAGSYFAGQNNGMIAALQTVRENYDRELAAMLAAAPASEAKDGKFRFISKEDMVPQREFNGRGGDGAKLAGSSAAGESEGETRARKLYEPDEYEDAFKGREQEQAVELADLESAIQWLERMVNHPAWKGICGDSHMPDNFRRVAALLRRAARVEVSDAMVDRVAEVLIPPGATRIRICEAYNLARRVIAAALEPKE